MFTSSGSPPSPEDSSSAALRMNNDDTDEQGRKVPSEFSTRILTENLLSLLGHSTAALSILNICQPWLVELTDLSVMSGE